MSPSLGKSASHLFLRGTKFYYRKVLPPDLYVKIGIKEIKISLETSSINEARSLSSFLDSQVKLLSNVFGRVKFLKEEQRYQIRRIVLNWIQKKKEEYLNLRAFGMNDFVIQIDADTGAIIHTTSENRVNELQDAINLEKAKLRGDVLSNTWIEKIATKLAEDNGIYVPKKEEEFTKASIPYRRLCLELRRAFVDIGTDEIERMMKGDSGIYREVVMKSAFPEAVLSTGLNEKNETQKGSECKLSNLLESYVHHKRSIDLSEKSVSEIESKCRLFIEVIGDPLAEELNDQMIFDYLDALRKIPARRTKIRKYRNKSIKDLLQQKIPEKDKLEEETIRNNINKVKSFVQWLEKRRYLPYGKFSSLFDQKKRTRRPHEARDVFSSEDLQTIFNHKDYLRFKKAWEFWLPLIALFTGMRINEICQLHLDDIAIEDKQWYFDIREGEGKTLKTKASQRIVPLHQELIALGLPEYIKILRRQGKKHLFPDRIGQKTSPSKTPGRKINGWLKQIGIIGDQKTGKKSFHSFRHTFSNRCKELDLSKLMKSEILGHSEGKGMDLIYTKPGGVKQLYDKIISKVHYGLDLTHLENYMKECGYDPWGGKKTTKTKSGKKPNPIIRN